MRLAARLPAVAFPLALAVLVGCAGKPEKPRPDDNTPDPGPPVAQLPTPPVVLPTPVVAPSPPAEVGPAPQVLPPDLLSDPLALDLVPERDLPTLRDERLPGLNDPLFDVPAPNVPLTDLTVESPEPLTDRPPTDTPRLPFGLEPPAAFAGDPFAAEPGVQRSAGEGGVVIPPGFAGRAGAAKANLLRRDGGTNTSEQAVATGLAWLARQQRMAKNSAVPLGHWQFDGDGRHNDDHIAATGMALLPFLAAGETHKSANGRYKTHVDAGLRFLISRLGQFGQFQNKDPQTGRMKGCGMYSQALATMALCEAYGMTQDKDLLYAPAQLAVNFIQGAQAPDGSWGYGPNATGDTSIVGWQVQALQAARLTRDLKVNENVLKKAIRFLDRVASGEGGLKSDYGYTQPNGAPGTSLTAVGLLCRYYADGWTPDRADFARGAVGLFGRGSDNPISVTKTDRRRAPNALRNPFGRDDSEVGTPPDMYYYYYATQVVHFHDGPAWREWYEGPRVSVFGAPVRTGGMRDWLVNLQVKQGPEAGSWRADGGHIGGACGQLGTTCLALLTLEVYYRHLPLYQRRAAEGLPPNP